MSKTYTVAKHPAASTKLVSTQSTAAQVAGRIRRELTDTFPGTKFRVTRGNSYDSVSIRWIDGPTTAQVYKITGKYELGNFNGMTDSYEYTNRRDDIPQVRYIFPDRDYSFPVLQAIVSHENARWGWDLKVALSSANNGTAYITRDNEVHTGYTWNSSQVMQIAQNISLVCDDCKAELMPFDRFCPMCGQSLTKEDAAA